MRGADGFLSVVVYYAFFFSGEDGHWSIVGYLSLEFGHVVVALRVDVRDDWRVVGWVLGANLFPVAMYN